MTDTNDQNEDVANDGSEDEPSLGEHAVSAKLLELLVCPVTRSQLTYDRKAQELISEKARLAYPIRDGIPVMLPDEARNLDDA